MEKRKYQSPVAVHPGDLIKEWLAENGMTSKEFSLRTGKPEKTISHILNGKSAIIKDVADRFEIVTGIPSDYILRFQAKYDADVARLAKKSSMERLWDNFGDLFPYNELVKKGWVERFTKEADKMRALLSFFALTSEEAFEEAYATYGVAYRRTGKASRSPYAVASWLRRGQILANKMAGTPHSPSKSKIEEQIPKFKEALKDGSLEELKSLCMNIGIKLVFVENLPKASISGATYSYGGSRVIQLSGKGKTLDKLTYNFFHELGHVYHDHKGILVDDIEESVESEDEQMADSFAHEAIYADIKQFTNKPTLSEVREEARRVGLAPCVVLGHLTHVGLVGYTESNSHYKPLQQNIEINFDTM